MRKTMVLLAGILWISGCQKSNAGSSYAQSESADNLKGLVSAIVAASTAGDHKKAAELTRGLLPDKAALDKALRDDAPADLRETLLDNAKAMPPDDDKVGGLIRPGAPGRTEILVHGATTEEIAKYEKGSVAFSEFPGGAKRLAEKALRPGVTFYELEFVEPGQDAGMKYHLFFWDGAHWRMLGPAWRGLPQ